MTKDSIEASNAHSHGGKYHSHGASTSSHAHDRIRGSNKVSKLFTSVSDAVLHPSKHHLSLGSLLHKSGTREPAPGDDLNDWGMTVDDEAEHVELFKQVLAEEPEVEAKRDTALSDERKLLRFLKARNFDIDKAREMYVKHLRWRKEFEVDDILFKTFPERESILELMPQGYHMSDKEGRPIYIQYVGAIKVHKVMAICTEETVLKLFIQEYEKFVHYKLPACSQAAGRYIEQSLNILDVNGLSLSVLTKETQRCLKKLTQITQDNYPEMMGKMIIINAPYIFKVFFSIVKPMLSSRTQSKIEVYGSKYLDKLLNYARIDCLPEDLGGTSRFTIFDDIGPWSNLTPEITSKKELDMYDSMQMSKWPRNSRDNDTEAYCSASGSSGTVDQKPSLVEWMSKLENDFEKSVVFRGMDMGDFSHLKFTTSTSNKDSLMFKLEALEAKVAHFMEFHHTHRAINASRGNSSDALVSNEHGCNGTSSDPVCVRLVNHPSWLRISQASSSSSLVTRMCIVEAKIKPLAVAATMSKQAGSHKGTKGSKKYRNKLWYRWFMCGALCGFCR